MKIFWSWQADTDPKRNRWFIQEALKAAVAKLANDYSVEPADRPELDHDTQNEAGMVEITAAIFDKILHCATFVADLTPIARTSAGKAIPNPNVAIELGWALKMPGWRRMIAVMNVADGYSAEDLPFDIRHRRALIYSLPTEATKPDRDRVLRSLTDALVAALRTNLAEHIEEKASAIAPTGVDPHPDDPSIWYFPNSIATFNDSLSPNGRGEFLIPEGPRAYARFIPGGWTRGLPRVSEIEAIASEHAVQPPLTGVSEGDFGPTEEGFIRLWYTGPRNQTPREAGNLAMYFDRTGEFWTTSTTAIYDGNGRTTLGVSGLVRGWAAALDRAMATFDRLGAMQNRSVEFGINGLGGVHWPGTFSHEAPPARKSAFWFERTSTDWSEEAKVKFLTEMYDALLDIFSLPAAAPGVVFAIAPRPEA